MNTSTQLSPPDPAQIAAALARLEAWSGLSGSSRLRSVLRYLVSETQAGRGSALRAKTIALDVYGYTPDEIADRESVVRVDAGRLRRKLTDYASGPGAEDDWHILLQKGSYTPIFFRNRTEVVPEAPTRGTILISPKALALAAVTVLICLAGISAFVLQDSAVDEATEARSLAERNAIFEVAPERLAAINLAEDGRDLIFPALDPNRLRAALQVFSAAIDTDPTYFGGYAGAAQVHATLAVLALPSGGMPQALDEARLNSARALDLAPEDPWSQSARAWTYFAARDFDSAQRLSARAVTLAPMDPHILEFDALISLFSGDFDRVIRETDRIIATSDEDLGFVFLNAAGSARFHTGDATGTVALFETAISAGGPIGPASVGYLMAANYKLGNRDRAAQLAEQYTQRWPDSRIDLLFAHLFKDPQYGYDLGDTMRGAGWQPG